MLLSGCQVTWRRDFEIFKMAGCVPDRSLIDFYGFTLSSNGWGSCDVMLNGAENETVQLCLSCLYFVCTFVKVLIPFVCVLCPINKFFGFHCWHSKMVDRSKRIYTNHLTVITQSSEAVPPIVKFDRVQWCGDEKNGNR